MEQKSKYVAPSTRRVTVELEQGFMNASADVQNPNADNGRIEEHKVNSDFDFTFTDQDWDNVGQQ